MVPGKACVVTGWGALKSNGDLPDYLQEVHVNVALNDKCKFVYPNYVIDDSMLCAGKIRGGYDLCQGDSGGPMVCKDTVGTKWYLHGITSWGAGCGKPKQYGVYANVITLLPWIKNNII